MLFHWTACSGGGNRERTFRRIVPRLNFTRRKHYVNDCGNAKNNECYPEYDSPFGEQRLHDQKKTDLVRKKNLVATKPPKLFAYIFCEQSNNIWANNTGKSTHSIRLRMEIPLKKNVTSKPFMQFIHLPEPL